MKKFFEIIKPYLPLFILVTALIAGPIAWWPLKKHKLGFLLHLYFFVGIGNCLPQLLFQLQKWRRKREPRIKKLWFKICPCMEEPKHAAFFGPCGAPLPYIFYSQRRALRLVESARWKGIISSRNKRKLMKQIRKSGLPLKDPPGVKSDLKRPKFDPSAIMLVVEIVATPK